MKRIELNMREQEKYEVIKNLVDHNGNKLRAATKLGITVRQVNRLIKKYKEIGKSSFIHGNRSKKPVNKIDLNISIDIITLYKEKYYDFNITHFKEMLENIENIKVSYKYLYTLLKANNIISPIANKRTRKQLKEMLNKKVEINTEESIISTEISHEVRIEDSHPRQEKPKYFGEIIEQDGSIHRWFGNSKACLHLAIDKATSTVVGAYFDYQETLNGYYHVLEQILKNYGIPYKFFTDNRTVFNYMSLNPDKRTSEKDVLTQYGYACKQLGIDLETSSVSQSKGLIERTNGTFQRRLVQELRLNNITTIEAANKYLLDVFVPFFNKHFALDYTKFESLFEERPSDEKINYTLATITIRKIDSGNSIKYKNKYYQPYKDNKLKCFLPKTECLVIKAFNGDLLLSIDDQILELVELQRNESVSEEFDIVVDKKPKTRKIYIPPMTHPWKLDSFKAQIEKAHTHHVYA